MMAEKKALRDAFGKTLVALGHEDPRIVALDADLSGSTRTSWFAKEFPHRFFNAGVAEADMIGTAAGLASVGLIPFASTFAVFGTGRCYDQIRQSVCLNESNVKIVVTHGGVTVGEDGASHQMLEDLSLMRGLPHMRVVVPSDYYETVAAVRCAAALEGPFFIRLTREKFPVIYAEGACPFELGKAHTLREGKDLGIAACGLLVHVALEASELLAAKGITTEVLNVSSIKPLDEAALEAMARKTGAVLTMEEHSVVGGLGSAVAETLGERFPVPLRRMGVRDSFGLSGKPEELLEHFGLTASGAVREAEALLGRKAGG
jgi:transketolase